MKPLIEVPVKKIMVRSANWIGDAVMTTPAMMAVRRAFPEAEIVVVANPVVAELLRGHPACDRLLPFDKRTAHRGLGGLARFCRNLREERFDLAILFQNAFEAALMACAGGIPLRLGYRGDARGLLLTHALKRPERQEHVHQVWYYLRLLERFGVPVAAEPELLLACTAEELAWSAAKLGEGQWLAINPGAAYGEAKRWFPERFAEVADCLADEFGFKVLLTGGAKEREIGREIAAVMRHEPLNLIGRTSIREMMALLARCALMITNDSGPMHVAAALRTPVVAVFGSTDHLATSPWAQHAKVVRHDLACSPCLKRVCPTGDFRCMKEITAEDVLEGARELLAETGLTRTQEMPADGPSHSYGKRS
ncbi:MAG: lipopolysaccharide heptosyltransferase II [Deltaproteobacteria bacterium]|nr:lipopolysaccharide heptosyltransferase II [Deltaproteobacteria bacterium]